MSFNSDIIRARAIIQYNNDNLILIRRITYIDNQLKEYYVFPGGQLKNDESTIDAIVREVYEELGIQIDVIKKLYTLKIFDNSVFYFCKYKKGIIGTGQGEEYTTLNSDKGIFIPVICPYTDLRRIRILPDQISNDLILSLDKQKNLELLPEKTFDF